MKSQGSPDNNGLVWCVYQVASFSRPSSMTLYATVDAQTKALNFSFPRQVQRPKPYRRFRQEMFPSIPALNLVNRLYTQLLLTMSCTFNPLILFSC